MMTHGRPVMFGVGMLAMLAAGTAHADLTDGQLKCVYALNKASVKIAYTHSKWMKYCVAHQPAMTEACVEADDAGKIESSILKAFSYDAKYCADPPEIAYVGAGTAAAVATQASTNTARDAVGNPVESGLYPCSTSPAECACQQQVIKKLGKTLYAAGKIFTKCKRGVTSQAGVEGCVTSAANPLSIEADSSGKLEKRRGLLVAALQRYCNPTHLDNDPFASGACPGASGPSGADCLMERVRCRACEMINGIDDLNIDCSAWLDSSCP